MESKLFVIAFVAICCISITESSYFAKRSILVRQRPVRPRTCSLQTLTNAKTQFRWAFPSNLSCDADVVVGLTSNNIVPEAAMGLQCTFTYSCPFDPPGPHRSTALTCSETGQWEGNMPDCSDDDEMAQTIIQTYGPGSSGEETVVEEERENSTETEAEEEPLESISLISIGNVRKSGNKTGNKTATVKLHEICEAEEMCSKLKTSQDCSKVVPKGTTRRQAAFARVKRKLCWFCFKKFCKKSVTLI